MLNDDLIFNCRSCILYILLMYPVSLKQSVATLCHEATGCGHFLLLVFVACLLLTAVRIPSLVRKRDVDCVEDDDEVTVRAMPNRAGASREANTNEVRAIGNSLNEDYWAINDKRPKDLAETFPPAHYESKSCMSTAKAFATDCCSNISDLTVTDQTETEKRVGPGTFPTEPDINEGAVTENLDRRATPDHLVGKHESLGDDGTNWTIVRRQLRNKTKR
jgi:hypothetical protein